MSAWRAWPSWTSARDRLETSSRRIPVVKRVRISARSRSSSRRGGAAVLVAGRQLQAVDVGDDPDQPLVDAGRAVRDAAHDLADVVA